MSIGVTIPLDEERTLRFDAEALMKAERVSERSMRQIAVMFTEGNVPMFVWVALLTGGLQNCIPGITETITLMLLKKHGIGENFNQKLAWASHYIMRAFNEAFPPNADAPDGSIAAPAPPPPTTPGPPSGNGPRSSGSESTAASSRSSSGS